MSIAEDAVIVRTKSHRAREKMERELGRKPQGYWMWDSPGYFYEVTEQEWAKRQGIKGLTRARVDRTKLMGCIDWGGPKVGEWHKQDCLKENPNDTSTLPNEP